MRYKLRNWLGIYALEREQDNNSEFLKREILKLQRQLEESNTELKKFSMFTRAIIDYLDVDIKHLFVDNPMYLPIEQPVIEIVKLKKRNKL